jgi:hypothetical protein
VNLSLEEIVVEQSKDKSHGDYATNLAMQLARPLGQSPRLIAAKLISHMEAGQFEKIDIAGPGFINFFLLPTALTSIIAKIVTDGAAYGSGDYGKGQTVNIEFVSANPTGALHLGHARGAALGDVIARLLEKTGYRVTREFYVNDAGTQIETWPGRSMLATPNRLERPWTCPKTVTTAKISLKSLRKSKPAMVPNSSIVTMPPFSRVKAFAANWPGFRPIWISIGSDSTSFPTRPPFENTAYWMKSRPN